MEPERTKKVIKWVTIIGVMFAFSFFLAILSIEIMHKWKVNKEKKESGAVSLFRNEECKYYNASENDLRTRIGNELKTVSRERLKEIVKKELQDYENMSKGRVKFIANEEQKQYYERCKILGEKILKIVDSIN
jgi:uncharacterized protein YpmS